MKKEELAQEKWEGVNKEVDFKSQLHPEQDREVMEGMSTLIIELEDAKMKIGFRGYTMDEKFTEEPRYFFRSKIIAELDACYAKRADMKKMGLIPIYLTFWEGEDRLEAVFFYVSVNMLSELKKFFKGK